MGEGIVIQPTRAGLPLRFRNLLNSRVARKRFAYRLNAVAHNIELRIIPAPLAESCLCFNHPELLRLSDRRLHMS